MTLLKALAIVWLVQIVFYFMSINILKIDDIDTIFSFGSAGGVMGVIAALALVDFNEKTK